MLLFSLPAGALLATLSLTSSSPSSPDKPEPHNGGLDSNATHVFLALSGSRPETTATNIHQMGCCRKEGNQLVVFKHGGDHGNIM